MEERLSPPSRDPLVRACADRGAGLVEVLVAAGLFAALAAGVAQLFAMSARSLVQARHRTSSLMLAIDKIEQLRAGGAPWGPALAGAGSAQTEFLSAAGQVLGGGGAAPPGAAYRRVTSVRPRASQPGMLIVRVRVGPGRSADDDGVSRGGAPDEVLLMTLLPAPEGP